MPSVAELERLEAMIGRLAPIANIQRGALIRAQTWNALVEAVIEIARAVLAEDPRATVPPHEHPDEVGLGWLSPGLRRLIERGPLADPVAVDRIAGVERQLRRFAARSEEVSAQVGEVRGLVTDVTTRDAVRERAVTTLSRKVEGRIDARQEILDVHQSLDSIRDQITTVLEVGSGLTVDGEPVDLALVVDRLRSLEELRERLRRPDGELLDAASLELRLTELTNTLVTEEELDQALQDLDLRVDPEEIVQIEERIVANVTEQVDARFEQLSGELDQRIVDASQSVRDDLQQQIAQTADALRGELDQRIAETDAAHAQRLAQAVDALRDELDQRIASLEDRLEEVEGAVRRERLVELIGEILREQLLAARALIREILEQILGQRGEDNLTLLIGIGDQRVASLQAAGITTFAQIAAMTPSQLSDILGLSVALIERLDIVGQARRLSGQG